MTPSPADTIGIVDGRVAGVSGDKYLGVLLDLGASESLLKKVAGAVEKCVPGTKRVEITTQKVERGDIGARLVTVESQEETVGRKGEVLKKSVDKCCQMLATSEWAARFSLIAMDTLLRAEARVHRQQPSQVELHEIGSADTLVDIIGTALLLEELGLNETEWWSTSIAVGGGASHFSGRDYPNPPPAVAEILRAHEFPLRSSSVGYELTTPTGAAITVNLAKSASDDYPTVRPTKIGYGAGAKELKEVANVLRVIVGRKVNQGHSHDDMVVLETNLDDVTGEVVGHALERLMDAGARDVSVTPIYMKKNRPGHLLSVIADGPKSEELAKIMIDETGTLGVREIPVRRHITLRTKETRNIHVRGKRYPVNVKVVLDEEGHVVGEKVEYEDRRKLARRTGTSLREIDKLSKLGTER